MMPPKRRRGARANVTATDAELRPYGFVPGQLKRWCAQCEQEWRGLGPGAFKCRPCAEKQFADVEALYVARFGADQ
jgi:hypothetical protein